MSSLQVIGVATIVGFTVFCALVSLIGDWQLRRRDEKALKRQAEGLRRAVSEQTVERPDREPVAV